MRQGQVLLVKWIVSKMSFCVPVPPLTFTGKLQQNYQIPKDYYLLLCLLPAGPTGTTVLDSVLSTRWFQLQALQVACYKINVFSTYFGVYHQKVLSASSVFIRLRYRRQPYHKVLLQTCIFTCFAGQQNETVLRILYRGRSYTSGFYQLLSHQMLLTIC